MEKLVNDYNNSFEETDSLNDFISSDGFDDSDIENYKNSFEKTDGYYEDCEFEAGIYNIAFGIAEDILNELEPKQEELNDIDIKYDE